MNLMAHQMGGFDRDKIVKGFNIRQTRRRQAGAVAQHDASLSIIRPRTGARAIRTGITILCLSFVYLTVTSASDLRTVLTLVSCVKILVIFRQSNNSNQT